MCVSIFYVLKTYKMEISDKKYCLGETEVWTCELPVSFRVHNFIRDHATQVNVIFSFQKCINNPVNMRGINIIFDQHDNWCLPKSHMKFNAVWFSKLTHIISIATATLCLQTLLWSMYRLWKSSYMFIASLMKKKKIEKNNYVVISCLGALTTSHTLKLTLSLMQICFSFFSLVQTRANIIKRLCEKLYFIPRCWESLEKGNINI